MEPFEPDFELIKMDAEIASYQEDFEPDERRDAVDASALEDQTSDDSA